jgi:hypothetical protein
VCVCVCVCTYVRVLSAGVYVCVSTVRYVPDLLSQYVSNTRSVNSSLFVGADTSLHVSGMKRSTAVVVA